MTRERETRDVLFRFKKEDQKIEIKTPNGGSSIWMVMITHNDDIIGSLKFNNEKSCTTFLANYANLKKDDWGHIILELDTENKPAE